MTTIDRPKRVLAVLDRAAKPAQLVVRLQADGGVKFYQPTKPNQPAPANDAWLFAMTLEQLRIASAQFNAVLRIQEMARQVPHHGPRSIHQRSQGWYE